MRDEAVVNRPSLGTQKKAITLRATKAECNPTQYTPVVLGVERGGTSMVAGVIRAMGICMGERAGLNHEDPNFLTENETAIVSYIAARNQSKDVWGFKMPKVTKKLEFYEENLRNPAYIVAYRNPLAIADSWIQRGAGNLHSVLDRIQSYQTSLAELYANTKAPVLLVNYERAVSSEENRRQFVQDLEAFLKLTLSNETRERAVAMMTGDGGGYLNLPEHFFAISKGDASRKSKQVPIIQEDPDPRDSAGWISQDKLQPQLIYKMSDGANFPKRFRLKLDFKHGEGTREPEGSVRLFFRYTDRFIVAHCAKPILVDGENYLNVETSGNADAIAIGPWQVPCRLKMQIEMFELPEGERVEQQVWAQDATPAWRKMVPPSVVKLAKRVITR